MSVIPNTNPSARSYLDNLVVNQLITQMNPGITYNLCNRRPVFNAFLRIVNKQSGGSIPIVPGDGKIISASRGLDFINTNILSTSLSGNIVTVTFDSAVEGIRQNDVAFYGTAWSDQGRVIEFKNGTGAYAKLAPLYGQTFSGSSFAAGQNLGFYGDSSVAVDSPAKGRRFLNPTLDYNYLEIAREGNYTARREKVSTRVTTDGSQPGVKILNGMWYQQAEADMLARMEMSLEFSRLFRDRGISQDADGTRYTNGGFRWAVKNRGGIFASFSTPITRDWLETQWGSLYDQNIGVGGQYIFFLGRGLWSAINAVYEQTIIQTGILNTFAGEDVQAFNIPLFTIPGVNKQIAVVEMPLFNEPTILNNARCTIPGYEKYTKLQMSGFMMQDNLLRSTDGRMLPQFTQYHFGDKEFYIGRLTGLDAAYSNQMSATDLRDSMISNPLDVATLRDLTQINVLTDSGIDGYGYGASWFEPTK